MFGPLQLEKYACSRMLLVSLSIHRHAVTACGFVFIDEKLCDLLLKYVQDAFFINSRLTIGAKGHIDAQFLKVSSVDLCIRAFYSLYQCKETKCYGKCDSSENS